MEKGSLFSQDVQGAYTVNLLQVVALSARLLSLLCVLHASSLGERAR